MSTNPKKKVKKRRKSGVYMITSVVFVLCFIFVYNSFDMKSQIRNNAEVEEDLRSQITQQEELKEELIKESEYVQSDDYIEEIARDKLGLVHKNEIIFKKQQN